MAPPGTGREPPPGGLSGPEDGCAAPPCGAAGAPPVCVPVAGQSVDGGAQPGPASARLPGANPDGVEPLSRGAAGPAAPFTGPGSAGAPVRSCGPPAGAAAGSHPVTGAPPCSGAAGEPPVMPDSPDCGAPRPGPSQPG
ncbi:hypothetical protein KRMM14A1004_23870 [Krasilnikovia sp. MM14-A1004]